ncbi:DUF2742 domain-containing protein, partial [Mycobacterium tuberculosis]
RRTRSKSSATSRSSWKPCAGKATEMIAAAHVHTISTYDPDRVAGFSPIPAMSMVSHAAGSRFVELIGGGAVTCQAASAEASRDVSAAADWPAVSR